MFTIENGREHFWRWDLNQRLICEDMKVGQEVHFAPVKSSDALVLETYDDAGRVVVDVPNELLQKPVSISVYCHAKDDKEEYTKYCKVFGVKDRPKPSDYVYTPTEVKRFEDLEEALENFEKEAIDIAAKAAVEIAEDILKEEVDALKEADENNATALQQLRTEYEEALKELQEADENNATAIQELTDAYNAKVAELEETEEENKQTFAELERICQNASTAAANAHTIANAAQSTATNASQQANIAQSTANNAVVAANNAQGTANYALEVVVDAHNTAREAKETAEKLATHTEWDYIVVNSSSLDRDLRTLSGRVLVKGGSWDGNKQAPINLGENIKHLRFRGTEFLAGALGVRFDGHCEKISGIYTDKSVTFNNIADEVEDCKIGSGYFVNQKVSNIYASGVEQTIFDGCDYVDNIRGTNIIFMGCTHINPYTCQMGKSGVPMMNENGTLSWLENADGGSYGS